MYILIRVNLLYTLCYEIPCKTVGSLLSVQSAVCEIDQGYWIQLDTKDLTN